MENRQGPPPAAALRQDGVTADPARLLSLRKYRMDCFFFAVHAVTDSASGRRRTAAMLSGLLRQRLITGADVAATRPHTLPWLALRAVLALRSGMGLLAWLVLLQSRA